MLGKRTLEQDNYVALILGFEERTPQHTSKPLAGFFQKLKMLGRGDVGKVYLVREKKSSKLFAMKGEHLSRAHAIVTELQANLDARHAPELCAELDRLYTRFLLFKYPPRMLTPPCTDRLRFVLCIPEMQARSSRTPTIRLPSVNVSS